MTGSLASRQANDLERGSPATARPVRDYFFVAVTVHVHFGKVTLPEASVWTSLP